MLEIGFFVFFSSSFFDSQRYPCNATFYLIIIEDIFVFLGLTEFNLANSNIFPVGEIHNETTIEKNQFTTIWNLNINKTTT